MISTLACPFFSFNLEQSRSHIHAHPYTPSKHHPNMAQKLYRKILAKNPLEILVIVTLWIQLRHLLEKKIRWQTYKQAKWLGNLLSFLSQLRSREVTFSWPAQSYDLHCVHDIVSSVGAQNTLIRHNIPGNHVYSAGCFMAIGKK